MNKRSQRIMEMAVRVRDFSRANSPADPSAASVLARLEERITRMAALDGQQLGGVLSRHSSVIRRQEVRRRLQRGILRHLVTIAQDAAEEKPELLGMFQLPPHNAAKATYLTLARTLLQQGKAEHELLLKHGLSTTLLDDLSAAVAEYEASITETIGGLQDHVLAGAELRRVSSEVIRLVGMLDGINRYRFEKDPQLLVAWRSAKHVVRGSRGEEIRPTEPTESAEPAQPQPSGRPGKVERAA